MNYIIHYSRYVNIIIDGGTLRSFMTRNSSTFYFIRGRYTFSSEIGTFYYPWLFVVVRKVENYFLLLVMEFQLAITEVLR